MKTRLPERELNTVNCPDRLSLDSYADTERAATAKYSSFTNNLGVAILGAKQLHMLRATIPNVQLQIPDYQLVFYYYELPDATTVPTAAHLKAVRLYPDDYVAPAGFTAFKKNIYFNDPAALVAQLNLAASAGGDNVTYNTLWVSGGVTFTYDTTRKHIQWYGNTASKYYANAGWNDPIVLASQADPTKITTYNFNTSTSIQPFAPGFTLNQRIGYTLSGTCTPPLSFGAAVANSIANLTGVAKITGSGGVVPHDSYPNLVYTQNIYLYANVISNNGLGNYGRKNLMAVIAVDVASFGIIQFIGSYNGGEAHPLPNEIYAVSIEMRDDANQPYTLPRGSANVNVELALDYGLPPYL
jgi:hypothetical protein